MLSPSLEDLTMKMEATKALQNNGILPYHYTLLPIFGGPHHEDGDSEVLQNTGTLLHH